MGTPQLIDTNPTMSVSSASSTFLVKDLKPGQAKSAKKSNKEEKAPVVPTMVLVKNNNDNNKEGWNKITKGNQKATSSGKAKGTIVSAINDHKITTSGHGNILATSIPPPIQRKWR